MSAVAIPMERDAVEVVGPDAAAYLQSQLSQDVSTLGVGASAWTFLLEPAGKVAVLARVARTGEDRFRLDTDAGFGDVLLTRVQRFKIRVAAEVQASPLTVVAVRGTTDRPDAALVGWGDGYDLASDAATDPTALGLPLGDPADLLDARIAACWPAMGAEIEPGVTIPAETGRAVIDAAVSFTKGCYPGQELVERMDSRGATAPRHLVVLDRRPGDAPGGDVSVGGVVVGRITSVGTRSVLALVRRGVEAAGRD